MTMPKYLIISGRSGSGKSTCLHLLEDMGYYCIDNLPFPLIENIPDSVSAKDKVAISVDVRNLPDNAEKINHFLSSSDFKFSIIYLDSQTETLVERFSATRRKHPLSSETMPLVEALKLETERLLPLFEAANHRIDTTRLSEVELRKRLRHIIEENPYTLALLFQSFGYKYGLPKDSDFIFDVRSLPNPYWNKVLRPYTGKDAPVIEFLENDKKVQAMKHDLIGFIERWLPEFREDHRNYLTISVGCTGGQHRSVYMVECLYEHFKKQDHNIQLRHRELP
jgi:UPF0042 nucleotide-binding protein